MPLLIYNQNLEDCLGDWMSEDKVVELLEMRGFDKYMAKVLSKVMNRNESVKAVFRTDGGYWFLMSRRIIILKPFVFGYKVAEIINHSQIERLYYNIDKGFFSSSMELKIKLKNEKTRTYKVKDDFDYVARAIDNLKYAKRKRKKSKNKDKRS